MIQCSSIRTYSPSALKCDSLLRPCVCAPCAWFPSTYRRAFLCCELDFSARPLFYTFLVIICSTVV
uniref:Uncharacterized protein n=1 Tax=Physcomitrium patens TaxID=3218 RepID=A0A2K1J0Y3_PHYPA|nr:hypothetical protein PHYPA_023088 [Physcomitrium patens]